MAFFIMLLVFLSGPVFSGEQNCPDLTRVDHPNVSSLGWQVAPVSNTTVTSGRHHFASVRLGNLQVAGRGWAMCLYDSNQLILIQYGKFSHPPLSPIWYHTRYYDQCDVDWQRCVFMRYQ